MERIIASRFRIIKKIGEGSFGKIYVSEDLKTHKRVAIKLESSKNKSPQLPAERKLYSTLEGCCSVPRLYYYGTEDHYNVLSMDLLGKSLEDQLIACKGRLSLKTVLMLADQMISCVEFVHNKNYIHRDIKPDNFVMGTGRNANKVYIIDFGLAKRYRDQFSHQHIPWIDGKSLTGTARYASINALKGVEQSRRDDMESLGYVWMYLLRGSLPWMGLKTDPKHKYQRIGEVKANTSVDELCRGYPQEFATYLMEVKKLHFKDVPCYSHYRQMFRSLFIRQGYLYDGMYDWTDPFSPIAHRQHSIPKSHEKVSTARQVSIKMDYFVKDRLDERRRTDTKHPPAVYAAHNSNSKMDLIHITKSDEKDISKRHDHMDISKGEVSARRIIRAPEKAQRQFLRADNRRQNETNPELAAKTSKTKMMYGPPRAMKYSQLPRWMSDAPYAITRSRV